MNRVIIAVVVCLIISDSTSATDQHLICKSMDDVFTSDEQIHSTRRLRGPIQQARPGKVGPPGEKGETGEKGHRGREGIVDYTLINETLNEMVTSATAELQAKVKKLENKALNMTEIHRLTTAELQAKVKKLEDKTLNMTEIHRLATAQLQAKVEKLEDETLNMMELHRLATGELQAKVEKLENKTLHMTKQLHLLDDCSYYGSIYGHRCYFLKVYSVTRAQGEQICSENNARLADIQDTSRQRVLMNYIRGKIPNGLPYLELWVGPKYEATTGTVRLSDGRSAYTLRWRPRYPSRSYTGIRLLTRSDESSSYQGIYNYAETNHADGVLCEK